MIWIIGRYGELWVVEIRTNRASVAMRDTERVPRANGVALGHRPITIAVSPDCMGCADWRDSMDKEWTRQGWRVDIQQVVVRAWDTQWVVVRAG